LTNHVNIKLVTTPAYHLWCDALHARELARTTTDSWSEGTYVRWTITSAWTVLEMCVKDAFNKTKLKHGLKGTIDRTLLADGLQAIDWGVGNWDNLLKLKETRNYYIHENAKQKELWPGIETANEAIIIIRNAIKDIYAIKNMQYPLWIDDDNEIGFN
jgi:hypothetical protein